MEIKTTKNTNINSNTNSKKHNSVEEITKQIEDLQIGTQVNYIKSKGFDHLKKIVKYLKKNNLDQELALLELQEKELIFLHKKKKHSNNENTSKMNEDNTNIPDEMLNQTVEKLKKLKQAKREEKYKQLFPDDTEFDWEKFKLRKTKFSESDLWKKIQRFKEEHYKKVFPNDTEFDWHKFKLYKQEEKKKSKGNKKEGDISEVGKIKKDKKYKELFPQDTEFNWEKFKAKKQELKKLLREKKDLSKKSKEAKDISQKKVEKFFKIFPKETTFDMQKLKQFRKEQRLNRKNKELNNDNKDNKLLMKIDKKEFKKIKMEIETSLYKELFPNDTECDWEKFKALKRNTKKEFKIKQALDSKYECPMFKNFQGIKEKLYKSLFPEHKEFDWNKFRKYKRDMKNSNTEINEKETKKDGPSKRQKREELYKQAFPNDTKFDWEKFMTLYPKEEKDKENLVREWSKDITSVYLDGNNMLYAENMIRKIQLQSQKNAEKIIILLAERFGVKASLKNLTLIYDSTKNIFTKNVEGLELKVCSARPDFNTSDDALVVWSEGKSALDFNSTLFVTSDRGLKIRLREKGAKLIMNSGTWFKVAKEIIGTTDFEGIITQTQSNLSSF